MYKYLITGLSGFVGGHYLEHLAKVEPSAEVLGLDVTPLDPGRIPERLTVRSEKADLLHAETVFTYIERFRPDYILHLASQSSVAYSWHYPVDCFLNNTNVFLNIVEAVRKTHTRCRILSIGSSEEYGNVDAADLPLKENSPLRPLSPYAVARVSQEMLSQIYSTGYGIDIIITRSFNHIGPGQNARFAIPSFIAQVIRSKLADQNDVTIKTGNLEIVRDFTDVRDVVRAYHLLLHGGHSGEIYNVCSGTGYRLGEIVEMIGKILEIDVHAEIDSNLVRPNDNPIIIGSNDKLRLRTGWLPQYTLRETLAVMIETMNDEIDPSS